MGDIQAINVHVNLHTLQWKVDGGKGKMVRKPCPIKYHFNWKFYKNKTCITETTLLERKWSAAGIPRYCTYWFMIVHELVHAFPIFVFYHELISTVSRNPR